MSIMTDSPIRFPGLFGDWAFTASSTAFHIGGKAIYWYGILIALGVLAALAFCMKQKERYGIKEDDLMDGVLWGVPLAIVGARLYYVLFYLDRFKKEDGSFDWAESVAIWDGGLAIYGGVIAAVLVCLVLSKKRGFKLGALTDLVVMGLLIGQAVGRWGNFMNREAFGAETTLPWRMQLTTVTGQLVEVHPTFLYESLWNLIGLLLILLVAGILTAGRTINGVAVQMSGRIVRHISEYHYRLLQVEFERSEGVLDASVQFMRERTAPTDAELHVLAATLMRMDPKAGCVWFAEAGGRTIRSYPRGKTPRTTEAAGDFRQRLIAATDGVSVRSHVTGSGRIQVWSMACPVTDRTGRRHICGIDFPLPEIYTCMTQSPASSGYATLFDPEGVIVYHPDSLKLGRPASDSTGLAAFRKVAATGQSVTVHAISDYLNIDEERIYYPIQLGGRRWVAGIGIPRLVIEQEIDDFHFYTVFAAVISVLFFAVLLVLAQRRWRREYDLRRHSERESAQLHLQQLLEQIDPHFLFNSLNSLYALIRCNPDQAREFTLTLSRVYRRVLERRKQILSTLAEEIDFTWQYYTLQKIRFDDRIELTSAIDPALRNWRIPSMSLQTLVENAVKHNSITGGNPLHIRIRTEGESFLIENNYTPRSDGDKESLGMGLERIRSVYRFYTEENISISVGDGTFRCRLPLLPPEK